MAQRKMTVLECYDLMASVADNIFLAALRVYRRNLWKKKVIAVTRPLSLNFTTMAAGGGAGTTGAEQSCTIELDYDANVRDMYFVDTAGAAIVDAGIGVRIEALTGGSDIVPGHCKTISGATEQALLPMVAVRNMDIIYSVAANKPFKISAAALTNTAVTDPTLVIELEPIGGAALT